MRSFAQAASRSFLGYVDAHEGPPAQAGLDEDLIVHEEAGAELEATIPLAPQRAPGGMVALHQPGKGHPFSWGARPPEGEGEVQGGHQAWEAEVTAVEVRREKAVVFHSYP